MIKKNVWEAVGKNLGFETGEAATAKKCFHQSSNKVCERKEELKRLKKSDTDVKKVMKAEKNMRDYLFLSWLDSFMYERNIQYNLQSNEEDMETSEPVEQYISEIHPDIFNNVDVNVELFY